MIIGYFIKAQSLIGMVTLMMVEVEIETPTSLHLAMYLCLMVELLLGAVRNMHVQHFLK